MIHTVPQNINVQDFVGSLGWQAESLFVTVLEVDYYKSFSPSWKEFVGDMPADMMLWRLRFLFKSGQTALEHDFIILVALELYIS